jgi:hypothetical protein
MTEQNNTKEKKSSYFLTPFFRLIIITHKHIPLSMLLSFSGIPTKHYVFKLHIKITYIWKDVQFSKDKTSL